MNKWILFFVLNILLMSSAYSENKVAIAPYTSTQEMTAKLTPNQALKLLIEGNGRFVNNQAIQRNLIKQAKVTSIKGQFPFAVILSCMDSRGSPELIFDQGFGDIFSIRVAGNIVDPDQLGSMEFATKVMSSKLIVVMGHTGCGAMKGACQNVELGNLTQLLQKITPAVQSVRNELKQNINCESPDILNAIAKQNVLNMIKQLKESSTIIRNQIQNQEVLVVGAIHELSTGEVTFFNENGVRIKI